MTMIATPEEQQQQIALVKQFYMQHGVDKSEADIVKTVNKFSYDSWTNPRTNEVEATGGFENMWTLLNSKYPQQQQQEQRDVVPVVQQQAPVVTQSQVPQSPVKVVHQAIGVQQAQQIQQPSPTDSYVPSPVATVERFVYAPVDGSTVVELPNQNPYPQPQQSINFMQYTQSPVRTEEVVVAGSPVYNGQQRQVVAANPQSLIRMELEKEDGIHGLTLDEHRAKTRAETVAVNARHGVPSYTTGQNIHKTEQAPEMKETTTKKDRTLDPELARKARMSRKSSGGSSLSLVDHGHHSPSNVNSTVRQLALNDQAGPRGNFSAGPAPSSSKSKPPTKSFKLVARLPGQPGSTMLASKTFKAHHLAENEAAGLTSLGASRRPNSTVGGGGGGMSAAQKAQLGGLRIPNGPSILRDELHKEDGVLDETRGLDAHRLLTRGQSTGFKNREWVNDARR